MEDNHKHHNQESFVDVEDVIKFRPLLRISIPEWSKDAQSHHQYKIELTKQNV